MPNTIPLVSELEWKATCKDGVSIDGFPFTYDYLRDLVGERVWLYGYDKAAWFTESCRQKLLAAMDNFGKVEEPEHWKFATHWAESNAAIGPTVQHSKCLIELRARVEALERGKV